jgi:hypothetical protein
MLGRRVDAAVVVAVMMMSSTCVAQHGASAVVNGLLYEIQTDAPVYWMYGPVTMSLSVTNVAPDTVLLHLECLGEQGEYIPLDFLVLPPFGPSVWRYPAGCYPMGQWDSLAPGASYNEEVVWDMTQISTGHHIARAGTYTIKAGLVLFDQPEYDYRIELEIQIVNPASGVLSDLPSSWGVIKALYGSESEE